MDYLTPDVWNAAQMAVHVVIYCVYDLIPICLITAPFDIIRCGKTFIKVLSHVNLFPFTVTQRQDWQGTGSGQRVRRPSDRLPFALQQSERKALPTTVLSPTTGLSSPIIHTSTFIPREPRPITRIRSTTQQ